VIGFTINHNEGTKIIKVMQAFKASLTVASPLKRHIRLAISDFKIKVYR